MKILITTAALGVLVSASPHAQGLAAAANAEAERRARTPKATTVYKDAPAAPTTDAASAPLPDRPVETQLVQSVEDKWEVHEDSNLQGSISGTVQRGRIFKTTSGNIYEVTGLTLQLVLELQPEVLVLRKGDTYKLIVDGFDEPLICRKLTPSGRGGRTSDSSSVRDSVIESRIDGEFSGWDGETIFRLRNGQVWQQTSYAYKYVYKYSPEVVIYRSNSGYKLRVDGVDGEISVTRLK